MVSSFDWIAPTLWPRWSGPLRQNTPTVERPQKWVDLRTPDGGIGCQDGTVVGRGPGWLLRNVPVPEQHLVAIVAGAVLQRASPVALPGPVAAHRLLGWPVAASGAYLAARSVRAARRVHLAHPDRLVGSGPYAMTRNPMYAGWALLHLGLAVAAGSGLILATLPAAVAATHLTVLREERRLADRFGAEFAAYRAAVPRYLPRRRWSDRQTSRCS
jgi:protein-S-isoprenylcysteine O-methyltransferase Ste14